jgi:hypothetical protein
VSEAVVSPGGVATIRYMPDEQHPAYLLYQRVLREKSLRGWTWTQLQEETGLARSTFNSWKTQPQPPVPRTVNEVADRLGIGREEALRLAGILTDGEPAADDRPEIVRDHWHDEGVREIWGLKNIPPAAKAGLVVALLRQQDPPAESAG